MIDHFLINQILIILVNVVGLWLAFFVYLNNRKSQANRLFLVMVIFALLWITLCYFGNAADKNIEYALLLAKVAYGITILFFIPFYFFFSVFVGDEKESLLLGIFISIISIFIFIFTLFTNWMVVEMVPAEILGVYIGVVPVLGFAKYIYFSFVFFVATVVIVKLFRRYLISSISEKIKLQYFLLGILIFIISNLIFNVAFPFWIGDARYYQIGNYSIIFFLGFTAYAIVKRELFGIKVVLTSILIGAIGLVLAIQVLIASSPLWRVIDIGIFVLFALFAHYLIKAVRSEEKRREEAELMAVQERALRYRAEKLADEFKRLDAAKTQFMLATQHHLRTPLTVIQGYLSMLYEGSYGKISEAAKPKIKAALESSQKLIKLVNDFLDVAQFEVGRETMAKREVQIEKVIEEIVQELEPQASEKGLYLRFEKPAEQLPRVMVDRQKIKEAIYNVVLNGVKYTERAGVTIRITNHESGIKNKEIIRIEISDTGIGMEKEEIAGLFERTFERGERAKKLYTTGRGIGLYLANQIIKANGGRLWAESEGRGKGSAFYIELPTEY